MILVYYLYLEREVDQKDQRISKGLLNHRLFNYVQRHLVRQDYLIKSIKRSLVRGT